MSNYISNGKDTLITENPGTLPNVQGAMANWFQPLTFSRITKTVVNFQVVETLTNFSFEGVRQPMKPQLLALKPEGQRAWKWETIHAYPDLILVPDEIIVFNGVNYRVMEKSDWKEYGYVEYHVIQDYTSS